MKVFISSTCYDLGEIRNRLRQFVTDLGHDPIMSDHGDVLYDPSEHTHVSCLNAVENADLLVLILSGRFGGSAVPQALSDIADYDVHKTNKLSITQVEAITAMQHQIPIYAFIEAGVNADHLFYEKNKANASVNLEELVFPNIKTKGTFRYIFEFVNFIRHRKIGNSLFPFNSGEDIENTLRFQWSAYFRKLLVLQRTSPSGLEAAIDQLGLKRISFQGSVDTKDLGPRICGARTVKVMFASGNRFLSTHYEDLRHCIHSGGELRILLANPAGPFLEDIEVMEGRSAEDGIAKEIADSIAKLKRMADEAKKGFTGKTGSPTVFYGFFRTHLRMSLIIVDDRYCYAILNYSPKRTSESLALLFDTEGLSDKSPAHHIIEHIDAVFALLNSGGKITRL